MVEQPVQPDNSPDLTRTEELSIAHLKAALKKPTFHVNVRRDRIVVTTFDNLSREVLIQWVDYVRAQDGKMRAPVRILFDFRGAGAPSRFVFDRLPGILAELHLPDDTRCGFLFDDGTIARFTRRALTQLPSNIGVTRDFLNLGPAIKWLREGVELPPDIDELEKK
ncbi:MAG: hypothetical protein K8L91_11860 [Anaerolineae bacterium]|nr:hypothetical protein [Anaerolineae bacterium]